MVMPTEDLLNVVVLITFDGCLHGKGCCDRCSTFSQRRQVALYILPNGGFSDFSAHAYLCDFLENMCK